MCFFEFDWTSGVWKFRIGDSFTDFRGTRSWDSLKDVRWDVNAAGLCLKKTDSRTYELLCRL